MRPSWRAIEALLAEYGYACPDRLRQARVDAGLTQNELGQAIKTRRARGRPSRSVEAWERGDRRLSDPEKIARVSVILRVKPGDLFPQERGDQ